MSTSETLALAGDVWNRGHIGIGMGENGLGEISYGASYTNNGTIIGHDITATGGGGVAAVVVTIEYIVEMIILAF